MPVSVSVPAPALVRPPLPVIPCAMVVLKPSVSKVPPPTSSAMARVAERLKLAPHCSVPPSKVSPPEAAPRFCRP